MTRSQILEIAYAGMVGWVTVNARFFPLEKIEELKGHVEDAEKILGVQIPIQRD